MKKFLFGLCVATAIGLPVSAMAADLDAPPPPTDDLRPASYDWSGMYAGAAVAAGCVYGSATESDNSAATPVVTHYKIKGCGPNLGLFAGFNYQMDSLVFGLEAGIDGMGEIAEVDSLKFDIEHMSTLKGRFGYAMDNTMFYGSAGLALASAGIEESVFDATSKTFNWEGQSNWHKGWTVGAGVEHAFTDVVRMRAGYDYTRLMVNGDYTTNCGCDTDLDFRNIHQFKVGMSIAF
jgi:outer membrane immunogenic protein